MTPIDRADGGIAPIFLRICRWPRQSARAEDPHAAHRAGHRLRRRSGDRHAGHRRRRAPGIAALHRAAGRAQSAGGIAAGQRSGGIAAAAALVARADRARRAHPAGQHRSARADLAAAHAASRQGAAEARRTICRNSMACVRPTPPSTACEPAEGSFFDAQQECSQRRGLRSGREAPKSSCWATVRRWASSSR